MRRPKQLSFIKAPTKSFGGGKVSGRKTARPLSFKKPIHLILKSKRARGALSLASISREITNLLNQTAKESGTKIFDHAVNWTHIHIVGQFLSREAYRQFVRSLACRIVAKLQKRSDQDLKVFFTETIFNRILEWGRDFKIAIAYILKNQLESVGIFPQAAPGHLRTKKEGEPSISKRAVIIAYRE